MIPSDDPDADLADILNASPLFQELARQIIEQEAKKPYQKLFAYYPEEGPLRRELYVKHMEFFAASATHTELALIAANRCVSFRTPISTPRGEVAAGLIRVGQLVWAWDGDQRTPGLVTDTIRKAPEALVRLRFSDKRWVECSLKHRVLLSSGEYVSVGSLLKSAPILQASTSGNDLSVLPSDVSRSTQTPLGYPGDYSTDSRRCGEQLLSEADNVPAFLPSPTDAQQPAAAWLREDGPGRTHNDIPLGMRHHPSSPDEGRRLAALSAVSGGSIHSIAVALLPDRHLDVSQPHAAEVVRLQSSGEVFLDQCSYALPLLQSDMGESISISSYELLPAQELFDFTIANWSNYCAGGVVHHNSGKSLALGYAVTCHLTGLYPEWWTGRRFAEAITCWMAGEDAKTVRDSMQEILFGKPGSLGTGLIPLDNIHGKPAPRAGVPDGIDSALIRHKSGGLSRLVLKAYDQGRESFQAAKVDVLGLDEEPPEDIYAEGLTRTMSTDPSKPNGLVLSAFTPLKGISKVVLMYLPGGKVGPIAPSRFVTTIGWNEVPHLSDTAKAAILDAYPLHQRDARSRGIPQLGSGAIYPVEESDIVVAPFELPGWYRCVFGLDVGWNKTAAVWVALDPETDVAYAYSEHYMGQEVPSVHAAAIQARGKWIPGVIDPAARGRSQHDGQRLFDAYVALGLNNLTLADNAVEAGIHIVYQRLASGRLKIFSTCQNLLSELRVYRRDEKGKVVKENDHGLDGLRYVCVSGLQRARGRPADTWEIKKKTAHQFEYDPMASAWGAS